LLTLLTIFGFYFYFCIHSKINKEIIKSFFFS
jgi:hypothetical protein